MNEYLNKVLQTKGKIDYIVASDTDSIYVTWINLLKRLVKVKQMDCRLYW